MSFVGSNILAGASGQGGGGYEIERSVRFNAGDSSNLYRDFSNGNITTWTWSGWIKRTKLGTQQFIFQGGNTDWNDDGLLFNSSDKLQITFHNGSNAVNGQLITTQLFRDVSAWYHVILVADTSNSNGNERMRLYVNGSRVTALDANINPSQNSGSHDINRAARHHIGAFRGSHNFLDGYLTESFFIDGQALAPTDFGEFDNDNVWQPIEYAGTYGTNGFHLDFKDNSSSAALGNDAAGSNNWTVNNFSVLNGNGNYNSTVTYSGTQHGAASRIFDGNTASGASGTASGIQNGTMTYTPSPSTYVSSTIKFWYSTGQSNTRFKVNGGSYITLPLPSGVGTYTHSFSGTLSSIEWNAPSNGELVSVHQIQIDNLILLNYSVGADNDSLVDSPSQIANQTDSGFGGTVVGNYCTFNPIVFSEPVLSNGNLEAGSNTAWKSAFGTIQMPSSGKWYFEATPASNLSIIGIAKIAPASNTYIGGWDDSYGWYGNVGKVNGPSNTQTSYANFAANDVIGLAYDADAGTLSFYKNGVSQGNAFTGLSGSFFPAISTYNGTIVANFGQRAFAYPLSSNPTYSQSVSGSVASSPYDATKMFDGSLTTYTDHAGANSTITWTYTLTSVTSLRVYIHEGNSTGTVTTVGGSGTQTDTIATNFGPGWHTISLTNTGSTINSIAFTRGGSGNPLSIYAIEVNGTVLVEGAGAIYESLTTANLPEPTVADGSKYFDTKLYTGNGGSQTISGLSFSPDFLWFKNRVATKDPRLTDIIRGTQIELYSSSTSGNYAQSQGVTAFNSDGATVGSDGGYNGSGQSMVLWAWDGGTSTVTNNDGSIASQVRAQPSAGFSIVTYSGNETGATVGHGLNAPLQMIWIKQTTNHSTTGKGDGNWIFGHTGVGMGSGRLILNGTYTNDSGSGAAQHWNSTAATSSVFSVGNSGNVNGSNNAAYVAYCFAPVEGYSAAFSWSGNGNDNGSFIYLGFRPKFVIMKDINASNNWQMLDAARDPFNVTVARLFPNQSVTENSNTSNFDFLSNGLKARNQYTTSLANTNFIGFAFAEHPFKTARAR